MSNIFDRILKTRSKTYIDRLIEDELEKLSPDEPSYTTLKALYEENNLDKIWLTAHEELGHVEEATALRDWLARKQVRSLRS